MTSSSMFSFSRQPKDQPAEPEVAAPKVVEEHPLDALTGGVFSAATSGERAQRVRDWLGTDPAVDDMQAVFKELSAKDKGAARALRERLDELRRAREQDSLAVEWQERAQTLLDAARLNIADALAWQRDAAKAGAPLSREPLASLRAQLVERIKAVEDLQQRVMVQREAAALLVQRIDLLSTKALTEAQTQREALEQDVGQWREQAGTLAADAQWPSLDLRYPPQLEAASTQLEAVWSAFVSVLEQALAAAADASLPLPAVPVWADELRAQRGLPEAEAAPETVAPAKPRIDPEQRVAASKAVEAGVKLLEQAVAAGHTKNMNSATQALRQSLKTHGPLIDDALEARVHAALVSAGELGGWQRWSADKVREQLLAQAEALLVKRRPRKGSKARPRPADGAQAVDEGVDPAEAVVQEPIATAPEAAETLESPAIAPTEADAVAASITAPADVPEAAAEPEPPADEAMLAEPEPAAETATSAEPVVATPGTEEGEFELVPAMGGRKLQEAIRKLRDEWKATDQSAPPNHGLWKRFDRACSAAYVFVEQWLEQARAQSAEHKGQRLALIDELKNWAQEAQEQPDWKTASRQLQRFGERWRNAGHLPEKMYAELQAQWKAALQQAAAPLEAEQKASIERRQALIAEAQALGADERLRIDAVRQLQQRWQAEAQTVPLERKREQRLWDSFRKPIDEAFQRKSAEREQQRTAMSAHDQAVLAAAKALEAANASGDAERIRQAMEQLEAATRGEALVAAPVATAGAAAAPAADAQTDGTAEQTPAEAVQADVQAPATGTEPVVEERPVVAASESEVAAEKPASAPAKPLVAMRGDDRPGAGPSQGVRPGERDDARGGPRGRRDGKDSRDGRDGRRGPGRFEGRGDARGPRPERADRGPRLGGAAFRAQREAVESAQATLRKLAAQAQGEALDRFVQAWQQRQPEQLPSAQDLGRGVSGGVRNQWAQAVEQGGGDGAQAATAMLRLEMAAEVSTPAEHQGARRQLQLELLTRRNDPLPAETWAQDVATVLAADHDDGRARRLQNALRGLLRKR